MYTEQLTQALSIVGKLDPVSLAAATPTAVKSVDMRKFKRALFILDVGVFGSSATVDMKLQASADNSSFTDLATLAPTLTGVAITQMTAGGGNNKLTSLEIRADQMPAGYRYVQALITVGTAATLVSGIALGGESAQKPGQVNDIAAVLQRLVVGGP